MRSGKAALRWATSPLARQYGTHDAPQPAQRTIWMDLPFNKFNFLLWGTHHGARCQILDEFLSSDDVAAYIVVKKKRNFSIKFNEWRNGFELSNQ